MNNVSALGEETFCSRARASARRLPPRAGALDPTGSTAPVIGREERAEAAAGVGAAAAEGRQWQLSGGPAGVGTGVAGARGAGGGGVSRPRYLLRGAAAPGSGERRPPGSRRAAGGGGGGQGSRGVGSGGPGWPEPPRIAAALCLRPKPGC